jgi:predicted ABC-type ATPase
VLNFEAVLKAANHAEEMRHNRIKNQQNFIFETVFSTQEKLDFIQYMPYEHVLNRSRIDLVVLI